jgi:Icc-related predicted phosphoesterase
MKETKIVAISDIHGELLKDLPNGDILTISGDICPVNGSHSPTNQMYWLKNHFFPWCDNLIRTKQFGDIVFIAGNHDFVFKKASIATEGDFYMDLPSGVHYLQDSEININGIHIYGTPWTPTFGNWAWMVGEDMLKLFFEKIPPNMDILLSHGPAFGWNDTIMQYQETDHLGSPALRDAILRASPSYVLQGHIHSGNHIPTKIPSRFNDHLDSFDMTSIVNVSILDENYIVAYKPFIFTIQK